MNNYSDKKGATKEKLQNVYKFCIEHFFVVCQGAEGRKQEAVEMKIRRFNNIKKHLFRVSESLLNQKKLWMDVELLFFFYSSNTELTFY